MGPPRQPSCGGFSALLYRPHQWPAFNVADSAIVVGAGLLVFESCSQVAEPAVGVAGFARGTAKALPYTGALFLRGCFALAQGCHGGGGGVFRLLFFRTSFRFGGVMILRQGVPAFRRLGTPALIVRE